MVTTNTGFTQNYRIKKGVIKTPIYPGESISSWLIRAALDCGTEPLTFTNFYWDKYRLWTYDLDRGFELINKDIYTDIKMLSLDQVIELQKHSLYAYLKPMNGDNTLIRGQVKWIIPRNARNRKYNIGQNYCSYCLNESSYLRYQWRLAWYLGCLKHNCLLENKCPHCGTLYQPHLLLADKKNIHYCYKCNKSIIQQHISLNTNQIAILKILDDVYKKNTGLCFRHVVSSFTYFSVLRYFINLLRRAAMIKASHAIARFVDYLGIKHDELCFPKTGLAFELLPVNERNKLLEYSVQIINCSKIDLINAIKQSGITQKAFLFEVYPNELKSIFEHALDGKVVARKEENRTSEFESIITINRRWERLKRRLHI